MWRRSRKSWNICWGVKGGKKLADLFFRIGKVEKMGMGVRKMREAMAKAGLRQPEFETNGFSMAVFFRSPDFALKGERAKKKQFGDSSEKVEAPV